MGLRLTREAVDFPRLTVTMRLSQICNTQTFHTHKAPLCLSQNYLLMHTLKQRREEGYVLLPELFTSVLGGELQPFLATCLSL